ncbi:MAG TPA: metallophosphoesterase [Solirubrobacteraceae bacterium]
MRTLVISDLHLGAVSGSDVLRRPALHAPLLEALDGIDRLVVLGDAVELRDRAQRDAAPLAAGFLAAVGEALGPDAELVLVPGNHDHGLVAGWIDGRLQTEPAGFLGLEQRLEPAEAGPLAAELARLAAPARVSIAYPGLWLRDDVYAFHGHYSDVHTTVPTFERLACGALTRWAVTLPAEGARPDDYEAVLSPIYAFLHAITQRAAEQDSLAAAGAGASARAWVALAGQRRRSRADQARRAALGLGFAGAVAAVNRAGIGPIRGDLSGAALRQGGLHGVREALRRLGVDAPYVIWGHSHRSGPWPADDPAEWTSAAGGRILNTGSWVYQPHFVSGPPGESAYWPGTAVELTDGAAPRLRRLLAGYDREALSPRPERRSRA